MIARLPPVGQPVLPVSDRTFELPSQPANVRSIDRTYDMFGFVPVWLNSGTAALAAALIAALACRPGRREVLLPAYACPDLIALGNNNVDANRQEIAGRGIRPGDFSRFPLAVLDGHTGTKIAAFKFDDDIP